MQLFHFYHHHYRVRDLIPSDFWLFEFSVWLHVLARSLISIFIPILLLQDGFSLSIVILYYVLYHAFDVPLNFFAGRLIELIGARKVMFLANIFIIFFFIGLNTITPDQFWFLIFLALLAALYDTFYWVGHLFLFMKSDTDASKAGSETGVLYSIKKIATMLGPIVGAGLLLFVSQTALVALAVILFLCSAIPLIYVDDFNDKPDLIKTSRWRLRDFFANTVDTNNLISTGLYSIHRKAELIIWPLFLYTIFGTIESVALVPMIVAATTIIFSLFTSRVTASTREKMIMLGGLLVATTWILRLFIEANTFYYLSIALTSIFALLITIPLDSNLFIRARTTDPLSASVFRNTFSMGSVLVILFMPLLLFVDIFQLSFALTAAAMLILIAVNYYFLTTESEAFDSITG